MMAQTLEARLTALEQSATRYRNAFVGLALLVSGVVLVGATTTDQVQEVVTTKMLRVVNDQGILIAGILGDSNGNGTLAVISKDGKPLIQAGASDSRDGLLTVNSKDGKQLIYAGDDVVNGNGLLQVNSKDEKELIYAGSSKLGTGGVFELKNKTGEGVVMLYADEYGNGVVGAYNRKGKGRTLESGP
jgi:hypothetical protein